jgi:integrase
LVKTPGKALETKPLYASKAEYRGGTEPGFRVHPLKLITAKQIAAFLVAEQARGVNDHAHDLRQRIKNIFRLAQSAGEIDHNSAEAMTAVLAPIPHAKHQPALVVREEMLAMIRQVEAVPAHPIIHAAFRLTLLTALRQGEIRFAAWKEICDLDGDAPIWIIPGHRMKGKTSHVPPDHKVPLSSQAVEFLLQVREMSGKSEWIFPSFQQGETVISGSAVDNLIKRAGFEGRQTAHGLRSCFSSIMKKRNRVDSNVIELMLAHSPPDEIASAYDREEYLEERRELAQIWADIVLDGAPSAAGLLATPRRRGNGRTKMKLNEEDNLV